MLSGSLQLQIIRQHFSNRLQRGPACLLKALKTIFTFCRNVMLFLKRNLCWLRDVLKKNILVLLNQTGRFMKALLGFMKKVVVWFGNLFRRDGGKPARERFSDALNAGDEDEMEKLAIESLFHQPPQHIRGFLSYLFCTSYFTGSGYLSTYIRETFHVEVVSKDQVEATLQIIKDIIANDTPLGEKDIILQKLLSGNCDLNDRTTLVKRAIKDKTIEATADNVKINKIVYGENLEQVIRLAKERKIAEVLRQEKNF